MAKTPEEKRQQKREHWASYSPKEKKRIAARRRAYYLAHREDVLKNSREMYQLIKKSSAFLDKVREQKRLWKRKVFAHKRINFVRRPSRIERDLRAKELV